MIIGGTYVRKLAFFGLRRTSVSSRLLAADVKAVDSGFLPMFLGGRGGRNHQGNGGEEDRVKLHLGCSVL